MLGRKLRARPSVFPPLFYLSNLLSFWAECVFISVVISHGQYKPLSYTRAFTIHDETAKLFVKIERVFTRRPLPCLSHYEYHSHSLTIQHPLTLFTQLLPDHQQVRCSGAVGHVGERFRCAVFTFRATPRERSNVRALFFKYRISTTYIYYQRAHIML